MSPDDFRHIALGLDGAAEGAHMGHPDFRANGKVFATLHADLIWGMVNLNPDQQRSFVLENPAAFVLENGAWGRAGCTKVRLDSVDEDALGEAITLAWQNTARKSASARSKPKRTAKRK